MNERDRRFKHSSKHRQRTGSSLVPLSGPVILRLCTNKLIVCRDIIHGLARELLLGSVIISWWTVPPWQVGIAAMLRRMHSGVVVTCPRLVDGHAIVNARARSGYAGTL